MDSEPSRAGADWRRLRHRPAERIAAEISAGQPDSAANRSAGVSAADEIFGRWKACENFNKLSIGPRTARPPPHKPPAPAHLNAPRARCKLLAGLYKRAPSLFAPTRTGLPDTCTSGRCARPRKRPIIVNDKDQRKSGQLSYYQQVFEKLEVENHRHRPGGRRRTGTRTRTVAGPMQMADDKFWRKMTNSLL